MIPRDWSRTEVEAIVDDYLVMLAAELAGTRYSKTTHRRALKSRLRDRSDPSIEFKHANISAALLDAGFPYIDGYKPRSNYQELLATVIAERMQTNPRLIELAAADADQPMTVPEVDDILLALTDPPRPRKPVSAVSEARPPLIRLPTNYLEREALNRSLGSAGELFVMNYEWARLILAGREALAGKIEHTSVVRGDHEGYDILSFDDDGAERLIEVKTTKYGGDTPFFVTRNEVSKSERERLRYHLYRLFTFKRSPRLFTLLGAIPETCRLSPATYLASPA